MTSERARATRVHVCSIYFVSPKKSKRSEFYSCMCCCLRNVTLGVIGTPTSCSAYFVEVTPTPVGYDQIKPALVEHLQQPACPAAVPSLFVACSWLERADKDRAAGSRIDFERQRIDQPQPVRVASVDTLQPLLVPLPSRRNGSVELLHSFENRELGSYFLKFFPASNFHSFIPRSLGKVSDIRISCLAFANLT